MPAKIPRPIRNEVITKWLSGVGRDKIAKDCGISTGMVSNITSSERTQGNFSPEDFDLIRQTALKLKQEGLSLDKLVSPLRLHSIIKNKNLKEEQVERLIEALDVHFFKKKGALTEEFTDDIIKLSEMSNKLNIPIDKLFEAVLEKRREKAKLIDEVEDLKMEKLRAIQDSRITSKDLAEYKRHRPIIEHCKKVEKLFHLKDRECEDLDKKLKHEKLARIQEQFLWEVNEDELQRVNMTLKDNTKDFQPIQPDELIEIVQQFLHSPLKYKKEIANLSKLIKRPKAGSEEAKFFGIPGDSNIIID